MIDSLLNYDTSLTRSTLVNILPFILTEIRNYTNQYFLTRTNNDILKIEDNYVYTKENPSLMFQVGDTIELLNSENNSLVYQIKELDDTKIKMEQPLVNEKNRNMKVIKLSFKNVNFKTIIGMINYQEKFGITSGIKSQTLGGYNVTYATPSGDSNTLYPIELYGGINCLKKLPDDYKEYRRKGYVRL